jgi:YVTN family beta-propeller protein
MFLSFKPSHIIYSASKYEMWMSDVTNNQVVWFTKNNTHWTQHGVISVGNNPRWMVLNKAESKAYIANQNTNTVSVVDAATHLVINTIIVGKSPCGIAIKE